MISYCSMTLKRRLESCNRALQSTEMRGLSQLEITMEGHHGGDPLPESHYLSQLKAPMDA